MALYGFSGFFLGFILGMIVNAILLRKVPREAYLKNTSLRTWFGLLNWGIAFVGLYAGLYFAHHH